MYCVLTESLAFVPVLALCIFLNCSFLLLAPLERTHIQRLCDNICHKCDQRNMS